LGGAAFSAEDPNKAAEEAYESGQPFFAEQRFVESADSFRKAYELKPSWKIFYNIGQAESAAKRYGSALDAFEQYLADGGDEIDATQTRKVYLRQPTCSMCKREMMRGTGRKAALRQFWWIQSPRALKNSGWSTITISAHTLSKMRRTFPPESLKTARA
jgi:tetratricopeptide (TPR) repeat protein